MENINFEGAKCENSLTDPGKYFTFKPPAFNKTDRESLTTPNKVPREEKEEEEEEEAVEIRCSETRSSSQRELTVVRSEERDGRCEMAGLDVTGRTGLTRHLLHLVSLLLPSLSLVPTVSLSLSLRSGAAPLGCAALPGAQVVSHLQNTSAPPCQEDIVFKQNSLSTQLLSFLINAKNSLVDQFL